MSHLESFSVTCTLCYEVAPQVVFRCVVILGVLHINRCLSRKTSGLDKIRLSRAQILWGIYYNKNVDFVKLLWEDFMFQIDNIDANKQEKMYYPRFTKAIIHHFISKDKSISMRNRIFRHTMRDSSAYNTYLAFATGSTIPKKARKFKKHAFPLKKKALVAVEELKKAPTKAERIKRIELLSEAASLKEAHDDDDDDDDDQQSDDERTESNDDKSVDLNKRDGEEEVQEDVHTPEDYVPTDDETNDVDEIMISNNIQ
ncbi:hypothetical protein Tco_1425691, partial [Tanacetum coccineum]